MRMKKMSTGRKNSITRLTNWQRTYSKKIENKLDEILPVAFAIVKETAHRFKENDVFEVTARTGTATWQPHAPQ